jgi:hypothetical protein
MYVCVSYTMYVFFFLFGSVLAGVKVLKPHGQHDQMNGNAVLAGMTEKQDVREKG